MNRAEAEARLREASAAYQGGRHAEARRLLEAVLAAGFENAQLLLFLAHVCGEQGDRGAEEAALDRLIASGERPIRALVMKGDCRAAAADGRAAADFYRAALAAAAAMPSPPPPEVAAELRRVETYIETITARYRGALDEALAEQGLTGSRQSRRFRHSVEMLNGTRQLFPQQPTGYFLPELPAIEWFEREEFAWAAQVEAATGEIKAELEALLAGEAGFEPFMKSARNQAPDSHRLTDNPEWSAFHLWEHGTPVEANIARCPRTVAALEGLPVPRLPAVAPSIFFSVLKAGGHIAPHHGLMNSRLVCHLPLVVPPDCGLRVGNETRAWEEGKLLIFDDSIEHEAWNRSDRDRIVLIFEVWRPELSADEQAAVTALIAARDRVEGRAAGGTVTQEAEARVRDLVLRGDVHARAGETRAAASFYQAALQAAREAGTLPQALLPDLQRAQTYARNAAADYQAHLERQLSPLEAGPRFGEAVDILFGRKAIQLQQPSAFYFPGLPQRPFYEREEFDWVPALEAETEAIRAELLALLDQGASFEPYVEAEENRPAQDFHGMLGDPSWGAFYLWRDGARVEENCGRCPRTAAALEKVPMTRIGARTPSVLFSLLRPGAHIPPHTGMLNSRLICHLPLVVPPGCWLRAGNEVRAWEEGRLLLFDDSFEHEARNESDSLRVILLFDIWKPELSEAERAGISAVFEAIDGFGG